jgi:predicted class III extradiol MEMO1 family dioxygenase
MQYWYRHPPTTTTTTTTNNTNNTYSSITQKKSKRDLIYFLDGPTKMQPHWEIQKGKVTENILLPPNHTVYMSYFWTSLFLNTI